MNIWKKFSNNLYYYYIYLEFSDALDLVNHVPIVFFQNHVVMAINVIQLQKNVWVLIRQEHGSVIEMANKYFNINLIESCFSLSVSIRNNIYQLVRVTCHLKSGSV